MNDNGSKNGVKKRGWIVNTAKISKLTRKNTGHQENRQLIEIISIS